MAPVLVEIGISITHQGNLLSGHIDLLKVKLSFLFVSYALRGIPPPPPPNLPYHTGLYSHPQFVFSENNSLRKKGVAYNNSTSL